MIFYFFKITFATVVNIKIDLWCKFLEFALPVGNKTFWHNNNRRKRVIFIVLCGICCICNHFAEQCNHLNSFSKSHIISKTTAQVILCQILHPFYTVILVTTETAVQFTIFERNFLSN